MSSAEQKVECVNRFIELANAMTSEGKSREMVSSALMTACAIYSTYVVTGNDGALKETGIAKITNLFSEELAHVQRTKIEQAKREGKQVPATQ